MRVLVAGATGVIGRALMPLLSSAGHEAIPLRADALDRDATIAAAREARPDAIVHHATKLPADYNPRRMRSQLAPTSRLRTEGTASLLAAAEATGARRFVAQSLAFAYAPRGPRVLDEDAPLNVDGPSQSSEVMRAVADLERQVAEAGGVVLRLGWLYGPGTWFARDGSLAETARRRQFPVVGDGEGVWSFVHVHDAAAATVAALEIDGPRTFNIVDDQPAPVREWLPEYARLLGAKPPRHVPRWLGRLVGGGVAVEGMTEQRGASNARARAELGWQPRYPDWRSGFAELLA